MTAGLRRLENAIGPSWSMVLTMNSLSTVLLLTTAALCAVAMAEEPVPTAAATPAPEVQAIDQRMDAYDQFRTMYDTGRYAEALPLAKRVVELSEADRDRDTELPIAYNNLGATQFQLQDYQAAQASYMKSLEFLETTQGISSKRMIVPLTGLGAAYAALDQHELAVQHFDRALAVSRRSEGLFNLEQLPLLDQAANSRFVLGDYAGVERDHLYALRIAEQQYGFDDPRTLPATMRLATFYESLNQFVAARGLYLRVRDISMKESGGFSPLTIRTLVAIGRTHRLQYTIEPESLDNQAAARDPVTGEAVGNGFQPSRGSTQVADRAGLKSIEQALQLLRSATDPPRALLAETLVEMGDWYQATSRGDTAIPFYAEASAIHAADTDPELRDPLAAPRMLVYRPPLASTRGIGDANSDVVIHQAVFKFDVSETGGTRNIAVVTTDMLDGQLAQCRRALERAIYSPRFENGKPAAAEGVLFTSKWYERRKAETPSTTG